MSVELSGAFERPLRTHRRIPRRVGCGTALCEDCDFLKSGIEGDDLRGDYLPRWNFDSKEFCPTHMGEDGVFLLVRHQQRFMFIDDGIYVAELNRRFAFDYEDQVLGHLSGVSPSRLFAAAQHNQRTIETVFGEDVFGECGRWRRTERSNI